MHTFLLKFSLGFALTLIVCVIGTMVWFTNVSGQFGGNDPFGGRILATQYCTCGVSILHLIGPPVGGFVIYRPGQSILHDYGNIFGGSPWTLGLRGNFEDCKKEPLCEPVGAGQVIGRVGTSLY